jgi:hypothetical protein
VDEVELAAIEAAIAQLSSVDRVYTTDLTDRQGTVCASVEKTIYVRRKEAGPP